MNAPSLRPVSPRIPGAGPILLTIPGLSDVPILASSSSPEVKFAWPGPYLCSGIWLTEETTADPIVIAKLRLRMLDDSRNELAIDGSGAVESMPALAIMGRSFRWQPFRRVIRSGAKWVFQIENDNLVTVVPQLYFRLEEE